MSDDKTKQRKQKLVIMHSGGWIATILKGLNDFDEDARNKILENTGRFCAMSHTLPSIQRIIERNGDIENRLQKFKTTFRLPVTWKKEGDQIQSIHLAYQQVKGSCLCPMVKAGAIELNSALCDCTKGWIKANFEALLGTQVSVKIEETVARGGNVCSFTVYPRKLPIA
jgi:hypothetical protein